LESAIDGGGGLHDVRAAGGVGRDMGEADVTTDLLGGVDQPAGKSDCLVSLVVVEDLVRRSAPHVVALVATTTVVGHEPLVIAPSS
jgi:hypothetical protein